MKNLFNSANKEASISKFIFQNHSPEAGGEDAEGGASQESVQLLKDAMDPSGFNQPAKQAEAMYKAIDGQMWDVIGDKQIKSDTNGQALLDSKFVTIGAGVTTAKIGNESIQVDGATGNMVINSGGKKTAIDRSSTIVKVNGQELKDSDASDILAPALDDAKRIFAQIQKQQENDAATAIANAELNN